MGDMMYYILTFFFYSILGHLFESVVYLFCEGESGFLYGFWTPVYGIGVVILFFIYDLLKRKKYSSKTILWFTFLTGFILLSIVECIGGYFLEYFFHTIFWNYEGLMFSSGKYVSLEISFIWGILSLVCVKFLKPITDRIIEKIPKWFMWVLIFLIFLDFIFVLLSKTDLLIFIQKFF